MKRQSQRQRKTVLSILLAVCLAVSGNMTLLAEEGQSGGVSGIVSEDIVLRAVDYDKEQSQETVLKSDIDGNGNAAVVTEEEGRVAWKFSTKADCTYYIKVAYYTVSGSSLQMERRLLIDGERATPTAISFKRSYSATREKRYDLQGNEIRREEKENVCWQEVFLTDTNGYKEEAYAFSLTAGEHTLILDSVLDRMAIGSVTLTTKQSEVMPYEEILTKNQADGTKDADTELRKVQGENYSAKSDASILIQNDRSSAATEPNSPDVIVYNTIGGSSWGTVGQWIEWKIEVPEDGWYQLGMRWRQHTKIGGMSYRSLSIDGEIPFEEARRLPFSYDNSWKTSCFGGEEPYRFYLTEGEHTIRMTVRLGELSGVLQQTNELLEELNGMYMQIIMVSGTSPDLKRDYNFKALIPDVIEQYNTVADRIDVLIDEIDNITGGKQSTTEFEEIRDLLRQLYEDPETTAKRMSDLASNISSLASWVSTSRSQPLEVDYLFVTKPEGEIPKAGKGFFQNLWFQLKQLIASYIVDYTSIGNTNEIAEDEEPLQVWVIAGTEQAQVIQKLINEEFVPNSSIPVKMQNVSEGALMPALFAGTGPDVVLNLTEATPVNYALRGVVADLNEFEDIDEVLAQYEPCSYASFQSDGGLYALPTTLDYPVLFYRRDVLEGMDISMEECETWDTMLQVVLPKLQMKNLKFGLTPSLVSYLTFYYQGDNNLYTDDCLNILLDSKEGINAFKDYTSIYTDYKQDLTFNFVNLFRSGEMPIAVMPYSQYYQLSVFAPEIEGKWGMALVPGTKDENGEINHATACTVTGASIMSGTDCKDDAWEFLKWWAGNETQAKYARNIETVLGIAGRVNPAANGARQTIPWTKEIQSLLQEQLSYCKGVPQVPGSYYVERYFNFAFRDVVYDGDDIVQTLISITDDINTEIQEKTIELKGQK